MSGSRSKKDRAAGARVPTLPTGTYRATGSPFSGTRLKVKGSDARRAISGECVLCGRFAQLELGHVVPRWAGKWLKDEGFVVGNYDSLGGTTRTQDIVKHYMMCRDCENFLGEAEGYLAWIVRGGASDLALARTTLHHEQGALFRLDGVQSGLVLRALLGILFKAHLSPHHIYRHIRLPEYALREVVDALRNDSYAANRFSLLTLKIVNLSVPGANPRARIDANLDAFGAGHRLTVRFGGFVFALHVGAVERFPFADEFPCLRSSDTSMRVAVGEFSDEPGIIPPGVGTMSKARGPLVDAAEDCPCGSGLQFSDCCQGRWLPPTIHHLDVTKKGPLG